VSSQKESNKLSLVRTEGKFTFLINDKEVYTGVIATDFKETQQIDYYGIVTCAPMKIEADNFIFKQENILNLIPGLPKGLQKANLGPNVNSIYTEKTPVISHDGKSIYFTVQGDPTNNNNSDDIYYSTATNDTVWSPKSAAGFPLNNSWPNSVISVSPDNNTLVLMHTYNPDGTPKGSGVSTATKTNDGWSVPVDLKVANYYNKGASNEFCVSADGKVLIMAIQRDDTYGSNDIYASFLQDNGEYTEPKNLGSTINTDAWEASPFLAADGVSLYFSTARHPGYGSADIFVSKRLDSTWTNWSVPQNMGPDINSSGWKLTILFLHLAHTLM
jgi:hypothetical protein